MADSTVVFPAPPLPPMVKTMRRLAGFLLALSVLMTFLFWDGELKRGYRCKGCPILSFQVETLLPVMALEEGAEGDRDCERYPDTTRIEL